MMKDDVDVASLVVALMIPFEDRIAALEQELTNMRSSIEQCVTYEQFEQLKSELGCAVTKQKATAVMCVHNMHELRALTETETAQQPVSVGNPDAVGPSKKKAQVKGEVGKGSAKGIVYRTPVRPPRPIQEHEHDVGSQQDGGGQDSDAFKFNFGDDNADGDTSGGIDKPNHKGGAKDQPVGKKQKSKAQKSPKQKAREADSAEEPSAFQFNFENPASAAPEAHNPSTSPTSNSKKPPSEGSTTAPSAQPEQPVQPQQPAVEAAPPSTSAKQQAREAKKKQKEAARLAAEAEDAAAVAEAKSRLGHELAWCIAQLDAGLLQPGELIEQQVKESEKVRKVLLSSKTPLVRKRHTMKLVFGDYRNLMKTLTVPDELLEAAKQTLREAGSID